VCDILSKEAGVESTWTKWPFPNPSAYSPKYTRFKTVSLTLGYLDLEPFLDKGPVGLDSDRIRQSRLHSKFSTRGIEDPEER
jgi:hypothetical protein